MSGKLTEKQKRFCEEYVIDLNATQACIRAGYSEKTAESKGSQLLRIVKVSNFIKELKNDISKRNKVSIDECVQSLAKIMRFDIAELYGADDNFKGIHQIPLEHRMAIQSLETSELKEMDMVIGDVQKIKTYDKLVAIEKLMKHLGGYKEDNDQKGKENQSVNLNIDGKNITLS